MNAPAERGMLDLTDHGNGLARCCRCSWHGAPTYIDGAASTYCPACEDEPDRARLTSSKVARNAPCPCGSGRKAKKCCH